MTISDYKKGIIKKAEIRAFNLYKQGLSLRDVGKVIGMSHQSVKRAVDKFTKNNKKVGK